MGKYLNGNWEKCLNRKHTLNTRKSLLTRDENVRSKKSGPDAGGKLLYLIKENQR
jgi:hypothetical protein